MNEEKSDFSKCTPPDIKDIPYYHFFHIFSTAISQIFQICELCRIHSQILENDRNSKTSIEYLAKVLSFFNLFKLFYYIIVCFALPPIFPFCNKIPLKTSQYFKSVKFTIVLQILITLAIRQEIPAHFDKWVGTSRLWAKAATFFGEGDEKA